jgi:hypothetical protein
MIVTDWIHSIAGFFVVIGLALGVWVSSYFLLLPLFVGLNLLQFGFSKFCPLGIVLKKLGVPETREACTSKGCGCSK